MGTKKELLNWARMQVGTKGGSKYWYDVYGWSGGGYPWCAVWDSDALQQSDTDCAYFPSTYAFDKSDMPKIGSAWVDPYSLVEGDMVAFDWDRDGSGDHVGVIESVISYGYYRTIEGNVSDMCDYRWRKVTDGIIGGIRPRYSDEPSGKLVVDGYFGKMTCLELQVTLQRHGYYTAYYLDGDFGYYTKLELQKYLRHLGYYGTEFLLDGDFGYYSVLALQRYLRKLGYYGNEYYLDGDWGYYTTVALQRALNDGKF